MDMYYNAMLCLSPFLTSCDLLNLCNCFKDVKLTHLLWVEWCYEHLYKQEKQTAYIFRKCLEYSTFQRIFARKEITYEIINCPLISCYPNVVRALIDHVNGTRNN